MHKYIYVYIYIYIYNFIYFSCRLGFSRRGSRSTRKAAVDTPTEPVADGPRSIPKCPGLVTSDWVQSRVSWWLHSSSPDVSGAWRPHNRMP